VLALSNQRGSAPIAQTLYEEDADSHAKRQSLIAERKALGQAHPMRAPDKQDRRDIQKLKKSWWDDHLYIKTLYNLLKSLINCGTLVLLIKEKQVKALTVVRVTRYEFELEDGQIIQHPEPLDDDIELIEFQRIYEKVYACINELIGSNDE
jgi:hypothetical protein